MATYPLIFPSLSRQPSMDSSKSVDDDTIRDQMESGYVATRPRFTRARRTWKINVRNLQAEDLRTLDNFAMVTAARGANPFLYPNLLENWSFEFPALNASDLVFGWNAQPVPQLNAAISTTRFEDGLQSLGFTTVAGQSVPANTTVTGLLTADKQIPCTVGEQYLFQGSANSNRGGLSANVLRSEPQIAFFDVNGNVVSTLSGTAISINSGLGWQLCSYAFTVPANAVAFSVSLAVSLVNSGSQAIVLDNSASVTWDSVGCALLTPLTPYGRMAGSAPLGCQVRFSKLPETSDVGFGAGVKRYGANFELTEV